MSSRRLGSNSIAWRPGCRNRTPRLKARSRSARASLKSPTLPNPVSWRRRATTCGSPCMRWACLSRNCAAVPGPMSGSGSLRVVRSGAWVRSDFILLERIVFNLVSNAVRYTSKGGVVVGCRGRGDRLRIEVWDAGPGIPQDQRQHIFGEFYRLAKADRDQRGGLGLGLAIVDRLCRLLDHPVELASTLGKGSCFSVTVPRVRAAAEIIKPPVSARSRFDASNGRLVVVIDDDPLVLEAMGGLMRGWGCSVVTGNTDSAVLAGLADYARPPDVIISDYHMRDGKTGIEAITRLRNALSTAIPAFLMSGDTDPEPLREARANGYPLLHKPVDPTALRAMLTQLLKKRQVAHAR